LTKKIKEMSADRMIRTHLKRPSLSRKRWGRVGIIACGLALAVALAAPAPLTAQQAVSLREQFPAGYQYHVSTRVDLAGALTLPATKEQPTPRPLVVTGSSAIEYDERVLAADARAEVEKTFRIYRRVDFQRNVGGVPQQGSIRLAVRRLVMLRLKPAEVPFSPDGPLTWGEIDLVRTDVFTPALVGLLPSAAVRPGETWTAADAAVQELTDLERIESGKLECRLESLTQLGGRRLARVTFAGTVGGVNEDGPNRQQLDGYLFFDLESNHLSYLYLKGVHFLLGKDGKEMGRIEGKFVLTRQAHGRSADLADQALRGVVIEPNADNTLLLYDNAELGVRFLYPRRWRVAGVRNGRQVALDESAGSGLLLTVEPPERVPTGAQFLAESRDWLRQQKARVLRETQPRRERTAAGDLEHFAVDVEMANQRAVLDYYVLRQPAGGATLAARLLPADLANLQKEVERIARSVTLAKGGRQ
jgi:hypothetical protein